MKELSESSIEKVEDKEVEFVLSDKELAENLSNRQLSEELENIRLKLNKEDPVNTYEDAIMAEAYMRLNKLEKKNTLDLKLI